MIKNATNHTEGWRKALGMVPVGTWRHKGLTLLEEKSGGYCDWEAVKGGKDYPMMR